MSQQINLLSPSSRKKRFSFTSPQAMAYGIGIAVSLSGAFAAYENYRLRSVEAEAAQVTALLKETGVEHGKTVGEQAVRKPNVELEVRIRELESQLRGRQEIIDALRRGLVGTTAGFSEYMRVFSRQSQHGVWLTGFDIAAGGEDLTLAGRALSAELVPAYLRRLNAESPIQGRQFASMVITQSASQRPAAKSAQDGQDAKDAIPRRAPPTNVEFVISSIGAGDDKARLGVAAQNSSSPSLSLRAPIEEAARGLPSGGVR